MRTGPEQFGAQGKRAAYQRLVQERKQCGACPGLTNCATVQGGELDSNRIGPYTRWQGNLDAELMVVAQDFADVATFERVGGWPGPRVGTNLVLVDLLAAAGIVIQPPAPGSPEDVLFFTNAVLCLKEGGMQTSVSRRHLRECGTRFLGSTIDIVRPRVVATLGTGALVAVLHANGLAWSGRLLDLIKSGKVFSLPAGPSVFPVCHPSKTVLNTTRRLDEQLGDWRRIGEWLRSPQNAAAH